MTLGHIVERLLELSGSYRTLLHWRAWQNWRSGEPELKILKHVVDAHRTAIDIGVADGVYSYHLARLVKRCIAFEPNPDCCKCLRRALPSNVELYEAAVSSAEGRTELRIPVVGGSSYSGWGTVDPHDQFIELGDCAVRTVSVRTIRLDDIDVGDVGFIKIDIEGHELEALAGMTKTLSHSKPSLLIEIRDYHGQEVSAATEFLSQFGYSGKRCGGSNYLFTPLSLP